MHPKRMGFRPIMSDPFPYNGDNAEAASRYALQKVINKNEYIIVLLHYLPTHE